MKTSIITVSYNSEKTIENTILSVLDQTVLPDEYFIIDGGSNDSTVFVAKNYKERFCQKGISYKIISEKDEGIYDAMNKGIKMASGDFIGIINSDDWYELSAIEKLKEMYKCKYFDVFYGDLCIRMENGKFFIKKARNSKFISSRYWNHPSMFVSKKIYEKYLYNSKEMFADFDFFLKLKKNNVKFEILNEVLANFRLGGISNNKSLISTLKDVKERYKIYRRNGYGKQYFFESLYVEIGKYIFINISKLLVIIKFI